ncbi:MAG: hypothetical protein WBX15_13805, partial [Thermoanaerobaculia bacterium]
LDMPETLLGIVTFGDDAVRIDGVPHAHVSMPFLAGEPLVEVWRSGEPIRQGREGQIRFAANAHVVFGVATASASRSFAGRRKRSERSGQALPLPGI